MSRIARIPLVTLAALMVASTASSAADPTYWDDVRPVLRKHCTVCHSARNLQEIDVSGGLALDTYEAALKGTQKPVILVGKSADSTLVRTLITTDEEKLMPRSSKPLEAEKIALIRRWIDTGAKEGKKPNDTVVASKTSVPKHARKLDVNLNTTTTPPAGLLGPGAAGKLALALKVGPLSPVTAVAFSPDGLKGPPLLAVGTYGRVTIWDIAAGKPVKVLTNVLGAVNDVRFSPDGTVLVVAGGQPSAKGDLRLYQVADWKLLGTLGGHEDVVFGIAFRPGVKPVQLASASFDKTVRLWNLAEQKLIRSFTGHSDFVYAVAFSPDGKWLVSASKDRSVKMADVETGKSIFTFSGMEQDVLAVAVSPDGKNVISSGFESSLYWWNPQTGQRVRAQGGHGIAVHELCFSKDGKLLASAGGDRTARLWDGTAGTLKTTLAVGSVTYAVALSADAKRVATGSFDGLVRLWDAASGKHLVTLLALPPEGEQLDWLAVTPEGYAAGSPSLATLGQWRMSAKPVAFDAVWKVLGQTDVVTKAVRGEAVPMPAWK